MLLAFIIAIVAIAADQLLKLLVTSTLQSGGTVTILGGLVKFFYCENKGMAFAEPKVAVYCVYNSCDFGNNYIPN